MQRFMLTTVDNPFNPFTHFDEWFAYDLRLGYNSCGLLAAYTVTSSELSEQDQALDTREGVRKLLKENPYGVHRIVDPSGDPVVLADATIEEELASTIIDSE